jgi:hypothetical protein
MTFPPSNAHIERNEAGEPTGWTVPEEPFWHDVCQGFHGDGQCPDEYDQVDEDKFNGGLDSWDF